MNDSLTATVAMQFVMQLIDPETGKLARIFDAAAENELRGIQGILQELCKQPPQKRPFEIQHPAWFDEAEMDYLSPGAKESRVRMVMHPYRRTVDDPQHKLDVEVRAHLCRDSQRLFKFLRKVPFDPWRLEVSRLKTVLLPLQTSDALLKNDIFMRQARERGFIPAELALANQPATSEDQRLVQTPSQLLSRGPITNVVSLDLFRKK